VTVHSHRHNNSSLLEISNSSKGDDSEDQSFSSELDFSLIREVMYKYSQKSHRRYFTVAEHCFLYAWFASNQAALGQTRKKIEGRGEDYCKRIFRDIEELRQEAVLSLQSMGGDKAQVYLAALKLDRE